MFNWIKVLRHSGSIKHIVIFVISVPQCVRAHCHAEHLICCIVCCFNGTNAGWRTQFISHWGIKISSKMTDWKFVLIASITITLLFCSNTPLFACILDSPKSIPQDMLLCILSFRERIDVKTFSYIPYCTILGAWFLKQLLNLGMVYFFIFFIFSKLRWPIAVGCLPSSCVVLTIVKGKLMHSGADQEDKM